MSNPVVDGIKKQVHGMSFLILIENQLEMVLEWLKN